MNYFAYYQITETAANGRNYLVYKALDKNANLVLLKMPNPDTLTPENISKLKNEFRVLNHFNSPYIIKAFDILKHNNNLAMIIEDFKGSYLKEYINKNAPVTNSEQLINSL